MIELHVTSIWVGGIFGFLLGIGVAFFACWVTDKQMGDRFSNGWDAGYKYGKLYSTEETQDEC